MSAHSSPEGLAMAGSPRIALSHVNVAPFVQQAARAFHEHGMLARFLTTLADRPERLWQRGASRLAGLVRFDLAGQFRRRAVREIPDRLVIDHPWRELVRLAAARIDRSGILGDLSHEWMETGFDRWVARRGLRGIDAMYGYENACSTTLRVAGREGLFRVYDTPAPEHRFSRAILDAEVGQESALNTAYQRHIRHPAREHRRDGRRQNEYGNADLIVTASTVTRDSFADYFHRRGRLAEADKLVIVPYGAPPPAESGCAGGSAGAGPVRFLWAGTFSLRKGVRYLVEAFRRLHPSSNAVVLDVYGSVSVPAALIAGLPDSVRFHGPVSRDELTLAYRRADLLLFPSLCDGFGMVATEALAQGLPVLTTPRAGACDLIRDRVNGFVVPPADADALAATMEWAIQNRDALAAMRAPSLEAAARWQWSDYRRELVRVVCERYQSARS